MPVWGDLFGGGSESSLAESFLLWNVASQFVGALLAPMITDLTQIMNELSVHAGVHQVLTPAELADMVVRGIIDPANAQSVAAASGTDGNDFTLMVESAGEPPGLEFLLEAWRRGYLGWDDTGPEAPSVERGIRTSRVYNYWADVIRKMAVVPMGVAEAVDAVVEGQITHDDGAKAAYANGIDADTFQVLVNTRGNPPSPMQLVTLYRRGLIPLEGTGPDVTSVQQGIYEGATKDKWWQLLADLAEYLPPARTITALEREGAITAAQAVDLYKKAGLSPELAAIYSAAASHGKTTTHKQLAESAVVQLYEAKLITAAQAEPMLTNLGYDTNEAGFVLALADHNVQAKSVTAAVTKIRTLYTGRKIDAAGAKKALADLQVPEGQIGPLMEVWDIEAQANVRDLTEAQIVEAWHYQIMTQDEAVAALGVLGYTPWDAWVLLSVKNKGPLDHQPPRGPGPSPVVT